MKNRFKNRNINKAKNKASTHVEKDIIDKVGKYNLSELSIISYRQDKDESAPKFIDIKGITLTMSITEDIFSDSIVGSVTVYDMQDIRSILPLTGLERLSLKFSTPGLPGYDFSEDNGIPFHIYKVDQVRKDTTSNYGQFYKLYFCSPEIYNNFVTTVSKAYAGPIEVAVEDILRQQKYLNSKKVFLFEATATNAKYIIPNLKPLEAIKFLCSKSIAGKYNNAGYLFYETSKGYNFRSLESMLAMNGTVARPTRWNYNTKIVRVKDSKKEEVKDIEARLMTVIRYEFSKPVDMVTNIINGLYANKLTVHNAFNKTLETHDFNYAANFQTQFHLESTGEATDIDKMITPDANLNDTGKALFENPDSKSMLVSETSKIHNDYEFTPVKDTLQKIMSQRAAYRNMNLSMLVYGNTNLNAGDVINFSSPILQPGDKLEENEYTSGRYLIMALKHTISVETGTHEMVLRCCKDSVRTPLPSESDPLLVGKEKDKTYNIYDIDEKVNTI